MRKLRLFLLTFFLVTGSLFAESLNAELHGSALVLLLDKNFIDENELLENLLSGLTASIEIEVKAYSRREGFMRIIGDPVLLAKKKTILIYRDLFTDSFVIESEMIREFQDMESLMTGLESLTVQASDISAGDYLDIDVHYFPVRLLPPFNLIGALMPYFYKKSASTSVELNL